MPWPGRKPYKDPGGQTRSGRGRHFEDDGGPALLRFIPEKAKAALASKEELDRALGAPMVKGALPQKKLIQRFIKLRQPVDLVLGLGDDDKASDVRKSVIEDFDKKGRLILAQTDPPVLKSHTGMTMELTFLVSGIGSGPGGRRGWRRLGYATRLIKLRRRYRLGPFLWVPVLIFERPREMKEISVRLSSRVAPTPDMDLGLYANPGNRKLGIIDLSVGGAMFHHPSGYGLKPGSHLDLELRTGEKSLAMGARVVRSVHQDAGRDATGVRFTSLSRRDLQDMNRLMREMTRHILKLRAGLNAGKEAKKAEKQKDI